MKKEVFVTATRSMRSYAAEVVEELERVFAKTHSSVSIIDGVNELKVENFKNGEMEVEILTSIRGKTVVLFANCARNPEKINVSEAKIELYLTVDALKRAQAEKIIVFEPFVSCSRSDRPTRRNSVGLWAHFKTLNTLGTDHRVTSQLQSDKSKVMIDPVHYVIDDIPVMSLLQEYICRRYIKSLDFLRTELRKNWAFCSVDAGGEKLTRRFAGAFEAPLVVAHKQRDYSRPHKVKSVSILTSQKLENKVLWIIDDMIDTGGSVIVLIDALLKEKPAEINLIAAHGIFTGAARKKLTTLCERGVINRIIITDTVPIPTPLKPEDFIPRLEVVKSVKSTAQVLRNIITNRSMSMVLQDFNGEKFFQEPEKTFFPDALPDDE
jgi:ribose-phosphate pyrophosphokinase